MAETIVSPGVFTREYDQSYLPVGISAIGAAIIGPTAKGPAFIPTLVESYSDFLKIFGDPDGTSYVPYTVKNYLKNAGRATIVRTVGTAGYDSGVFAIYFSGSNFISSSVAILAPTNAGTITGWSVTQSGASGVTSFSLTCSTAVTYSLSLNAASANYIGNVFDSNPFSTKPVYLYANYPTNQSASVATVGGVVTGPATGSLTGAIIANGIKTVPAGTTLAYVEAITPWIQSQTISGKNYKLFRFVTSNCGTPDIKIAIQDLKWAGTVAGSDYGTFTVVVRGTSDDTDSRQNVLEQYIGVTLDPNSVNYIARAIGDQYRRFEADNDGNSKLNVYGDYPNQSKRIRIEMAVDDIIPVNAAPMGTDKYNMPISTAAANLPAPNYATIRYNSTNGIWDPKKYLGIDFTKDDNLTLMLPPVSNAGTVIAESGSGFNLENILVEISAAPFSASWAISGSSSKSSDRRFITAFQGGFDGFNATTKKCTEASMSQANSMGFNFAGSAGSGYVSYTKAIDSISNPDEFDINMLIMPGVLQEYAANVVTYAMNMCEDRQDTFFVFDLAAITKAPVGAVGLVAGTDSNYSATYYPWVKIYDDVNNKYLWVPPSVVMAGVIAFNDRVAAEWYAPAGLNRGGIDTAIQVYTRLTKAERDTLYEGRVNPIAMFVGQGIVAWGQKTLQAKASALDRISVRRLLIALKKYIASSSKYLVFEQNTVATRTRFLNIVNPYLESVQQRQGLYAFKVVMDETNNTPDLIDRNIMYGQIWLQPSRTAEMIIIDFNIMPTGASFSA